MEDTTVVADEYPACGSFDDMDLPDNLLRGIYAHGFECPSAVEQRVIRPVVQGRDMVCHAKSGTGKTASWMIGSLARIDTNVLACQALALAPTREHAMNMQGLLRALGEHLQARCCVCIGGTSMRTTVDHLRAGQHLVLGTPGRVLDVLKRKLLDVEHLKILILDEADELLSRGFQDQIHDLFLELNPEVQVCLFSATLPHAIFQLEERFMRNPVRIVGKSDRPSLEGIRQYYIVTENEDSKLQLLTDLCQRLMIIQVVIYCNTRATADAIAHTLQAVDFTVSVVHAGLTDEERQLARRQFACGLSRVLISTGRLAPGSDVSSASLMLNYDLPEDTEDYSHRIGRSGRFGRRGIAINLVLSQAVQEVRDIEQHYSTSMEELPADFPADFPADIADSSWPHRSVRWRSLDGLPSSPVER